MPLVGGQELMPGETKTKAKPVMGELRGFLFVGNKRKTHIGAEKGKNESLEKEEKGRDEQTGKGRGRVFSEDS